MNISKTMLLLALIFSSSTSYASEDYYDFQWEIKKMEEKNVYQRGPSEFQDKEAEEYIIELKNEPIVVEIGESTNSK